MNKATNHRILLFFILLGSFIGQTFGQDRVLDLKHLSNDKVCVVSHRGDWRNAPENSLQAIQNCINMGVDMVEIDVQLTKDGKAVLLHDGTLDRTTTGRGRVGDWTLDSLKILYLKDGLGVATYQHIPTLEEALILCKGNILVNVDKGYDLFPTCYEIAKKTGTLNQVVLKADKSYDEVKAKLGAGFEEVYFMPVINLDSKKSLDMLEDYLKNHKPVAIEFTLSNDQNPIIKRFKEFRQSGINIWVNALWARLNGGHDDEKAAVDPSVYDWYLEHGVNIIQTDRPQLLINYLSKAAVKEKL